MKIWKSPYVGLFVDEKKVTAILASNNMLTMHPSTIILVKLISGSSSIGNSEYSS